MTGETTRWEYRTLRPPRGSAGAEAADPQAELNELGDDAVRPREQRPPGRRP